MISEDKAKNKNKDLYYNELKYKKLVKETMQSEVEYGSEVVTFWNDIQKMELHRLELIQQAFKFYLSKYEDTYGKLPAMDNAIKNLGQFDAKVEGAKNFELEALLNAEDLSSIQKELKRENKISYQDVVHYISEYRITGLEKTSILQVKQFLCQRDTGSVNKLFKPCELIVTSDDYLLIFDEPTGDQIKRASKKFHTSLLAARKRKEKVEQCYIIETVPGLIYNSESKVLLKFESEAQTNQFIQFLESYKKQLDSEG